MRGSSHRYLGGTSLGQVRSEGEITFTTPHVHRKKVLIGWAISAHLQRYITGGLRADGVSDNDAACAEMSETETLSVAEGQVLTTTRWDFYVWSRSTGNGAADTSLLHFFPNSLPLVLGKVRCPEATNTLRHIHCRYRMFNRQLRCKYFNPNKFLITLYTIQKVYFCQPIQSFPFDAAMGFCDFGAQLSNWPR